MKKNKVGRERVMEAFLGNGKQEGFFKEVALMQVLAQGGCATQLLRTPFVL